MIELNLHISIKSEFAEGIASELGRLGLAMSSGLGVGPHGTSTADPIDAPRPNEPTPPTPAAAEAPKATRRRGPKADDPDAKPPEAAKANGAAQPDRAAIIEGLTKIYSKGDPDVRSKITEFRDKHGAERLRDLKDDDLPAAAQLLIALKVNEAADAV